MECPMGSISSIITTREHPVLSAIGALIDVRVTACEGAWGLHAVSLQHSMKALNSGQSHERPLLPLHDLKSIKGAMQLQATACGLSIRITARHLPHPITFQNGAIEFSALHDGLTHTSS